MRILATSRLAAAPAMLPLAALASTAALAALAEGIAALLGAPHAATSTVILVGLVGVFVVAGVLTASGRTTPAVVLAAVGLLTAVVAFGLEYGVVHGVLYVVPIAFVLVVRRLSGPRLAAFAVLATLVSIVVAMYDLGDELGVSATAFEVAAGVIAAGLTSGILFALTWRTVRDAEAANERVASILEESPVGIVRTSADGRFLEANEAYARLLGYPSRDAILGTSVANVYANARDAEAIRALVRRDGEVTATTQLVRVDGERIWVRFRTRARNDAQGVVAWYDSLVEDITAERAHAEARAELAAVVESAADAILVKDLDGTITAWNAAAERMYGWLADDAIGRNVSIIAPDEDDDALRGLMARAAAGERVGPIDVGRRTRDGRALMVSIVLSPVRDRDGVITGISSVARDVTEERRLATENRRLDDELRQAQRLEAIGRLAGGVAHDFNNTLTAIQGFADLLADVVADRPEAADYVGRIQSGAAHAADLTSQLLGFARRQVVQPRVLDLNTIVVDVAPMLDRAAGEARTVELALAADPVHVCVDPSQVVQVLMNLVMNARDAMPAGGTIRVSTEARATTSSVLVGAAESAAHLTVSDTGRGIDPDVLPHVFEPFYTTKDVGAGTGLGLASVYGIVTQAGGKVEIATGRRGTTVDVVLPIAHIDPAPEIAPPEPAPQARALAVLVVDDQPVIRAIAGRILRREGMDVAEAADGIEALEHVRGNLVDVLLTDVLMPRMTGPQLVAAVREDRPSLPVVFMSGYAGEREVEELNGPNSRFVAKPFSAQALVAAVTGVVETAERAGFAAVAN